MRISIIGDSKNWYKSTVNSLLNMIESRNHTSDELIKIFIDSDTKEYDKVLNVCNLLKRIKPQKIRTYQLGEVRGAAILLYLMGSSRFAYNEMKYDHNFELPNVKNDIKLWLSKEQLEQEVERIYRFINQYNPLLFEYMFEAAKEESFPESMSSAKAKELGIITNWYNDLYVPIV